MPGPGPSITDAHPSLEFAAPKTLYRELRTDNLAAVNRRREEVLSYLTGLSDPEADAIRSAQLANIRFVNGQIAMARNDLQTAVRNLTPAQQVLDSDEEVRSLLSLGLYGLAKEYFKQGLYGNARSQIEQAVRISPQFLAARYLFAELLHALKESEAAIAEYREILRRDAAGLEVALQIGEIFEETGRYEEAAQQYQRAVGIRGDDPKVHQRIARLRYKMGEFEAAAVSLEYALAREPEDDSMLYNLAETYERVDCTKAKQAWHRFLGKAAESEIDPGQILAVRNRLPGLADSKGPCEGDRSR